MSKKILICGGAGFIGHNLAKKLKSEGNEVTVVDIKNPEFEPTPADEFILGDLRSQSVVNGVFKDKFFDEVYQLAADMGGAGFVFTGEHDADILRNSVLINANILEYHEKYNKIFYSSSACVYPEGRQTDLSSAPLKEEYAYPANPDSDYGWEKIFSERLYQAYSKNYGLNVRIARFHNIFGPLGTWTGGREKAPAAICRKVASAVISGVDTIEIWGDGEQRRSFLYIDECLKGIELLMASNYQEPINIGSTEQVSINELCVLTQLIAGIKDPIKINHVDVKALGVRGRSSDNNKIREILHWAPNYPLEKGLRITYNWIKEMIERGDLTR